LTRQPCNWATPIWTRSPSRSNARARAVAHPAPLAPHAHSARRHEAR
jgi:hypothetical protein